MAYLTIVIPVRDDAGALATLLEELRPAAGARCEIIVVDGGSRDDSARVAQGSADRVLTSPPGRARQLAAGVSVARGELIWLLHADSRVEPGHVTDLEAVLDGGVRLWGRFDVRLDGSGWLLRATEWLMNRRSCMTGICTGDQGIFARRAMLEAVGGIPQQPLMEDVELSKRLRRLGKPLCARRRLTTSARRWQREGVLTTIVLMWTLRARYFFGADPATLARSYYGEGRPG